MNLIAYLVKNIFMFGSVIAFNLLNKHLDFFFVPSSSETLFMSTHLGVDPRSVEVRVIAVSKRNLSKTRLRVNFRQFAPINNCLLSPFYNTRIAYWCPSRVPLFENPRRDRILPLCRAASRGLFMYREKLQFF